MYQFVVLFAHKILTILARIGWAVTTEDLNVVLHLIDRQADAVS